MEETVIIQFIISERFNIRILNFLMFALLVRSDYFCTDLVCLWNESVKSFAGIVSSFSLSRFFFFNATSSCRISRVLVCFILEHYWLLFFQLSFEKLNTFLKAIYFSILFGMQFISILFPCLFYLSLAL